MAQHYSSEQIDGVLDEAYDYLNRANRLSAGKWYENRRALVEIIEQLRGELESLKKPRVRKSRA